MPEHRLAPTEKGCPACIWRACAYYKYGKLDPSAVSFAWGRTPADPSTRSAQFFRDVADAVEARDELLSGRVDLDPNVPVARLQFCISQAYLELVCKRVWELKISVPPPSDLENWWDRDRLPDEVLPTRADHLKRLSEDRFMRDFYSARVDPIVSDRPGASERSETAE